MILQKRKYLFIDRDGTLIDEPKSNFQVDSFDKLKFKKDVISALKEVVESTDYRLVMVSNQDGLGTESLPYSDFNGPHKLMLEIFKGEGVVFEDILIDPSFPEEHSINRKPQIGLVKSYLNDLLDYDNSYVIGDRLTDIQLAENMGIKSIWYGTSEAPDNLSISFQSDSWKEIQQFISQGSRRVECSRKTSETSINIVLDLNGEGKSTISTGIEFFNHMLDQIARHGLVDLTIQTKGDLQVDAHHTIEDTALLLGEAFNQALGSKKGVARYGFALPMDECEAKVLLDFGGRSYLVWDVDLQKEYVGDFPTDMAKHFFHSFCQTAKCNLNISAEGENTHHIIEAVFKAFARSIKQAILQTGNILPSSKGIL